MLELALLISNLLFYIGLGIFIGWILFYDCK